MKFSSYLVKAQNNILKSKKINRITKKIIMLKYDILNILNV